MSLEGFSKKGMELGNNPEGIVESRNDLKKQYLNAIKRLAFEKMRNDILFEGKLGATIRNLSSIGLNVTRESILKDIELEINKQKADLNLDKYSTQEIDKINGVLEDMNVESLDSSLPLDKTKANTADETEALIKNLKSNLGNIFEFSTTKEQRPVNASSTILKEPIIQSVNEQSNESTKNFIGDLTNLSEDVKQRIIQQMESRGGVIISEIDKVYQEGNYVVVDAKQSNGRFVGTEYTLEEFTKIVNQPLEKTNQEISQTNQISQQPFDYINNENQQSVIKQSNQEQINQNEPKIDLQEQQKQMKDKIVSRIMSAMNKAGEFSFGDISMGERMSIMQNVQNKLNTKSIDELQMLLVTYQEQSIQEDIMNNGMSK